MGGFITAEQSSWNLRPGRFISRHTCYLMHIPGRVYTAVPGMYCFNIKSSFDAGVNFPQEHVSRLPFCDHICTTYYFSSAIPIVWTFIPQRRPQRYST